VSLMPVQDTGVPIQVDQRGILRALKLNPDDPKTQALLVVCDRYNLDPVLRHMVLVDGNPYVTRDGLLHVAHSSRQFDGMEVVAMGENEKEWTATVSVYRKDMSRPFTYPGRYSKSSSNKKYGPEMALKTAEVMALRRAFDVTGIAVLEEQDDKHDAVLAAQGLQLVDGDGPEGALNVVSPQAAVLDGEDPDWVVKPGWAKTEILAAVDGDRDRAAELWAKFDRHIDEGTALTVGAVRAFLANLPDDVEDATGDEVEIVEPGDRGDDHLVPSEQDLYDAATSHQDVAGDIAPIDPPARPAPGGDDRPERTPNAASSSPSATTAPRDRADYPAQDPRGRVAKRAATAAKRAADRALASRDHVDTLRATVASLDPDAERQVTEWLTVNSVVVEHGTLTADDYERAIAHIDKTVEG
jgi:hypothetical protein